MAHVLAETGEKFRAAAKHVAEVEWRGLPDDVTHLITNEARAADLVIIGREQDSDNPYYGLDTSAAVARMGRPALLVPEGIESLKAQRILIAWKDTREARRAVLDALPFLQRAETVVIVEILEEGEENGASHRLKDVANYLTRHRVDIITQQVRPADVTAANSLLRLIEDENIDLLVAGAYGHSRLGEWAFGGVTRDLLRESPICCLFSH
jgi:nucleotide-binding universal stress UspA family protein